VILVVEIWISDSVLCMFRSDISDYDYNLSWI
jgi:hypothetical protein